MTRLLQASLVLAVVLSLGCAARAAQRFENDARAVLEAQVPLSQAVTAAEMHAHGRAARAEYERTRDGWAYDVEVVGRDAVYDVRVDAAKGTVISSTRDTAGHEDREDRDRDHDDDSDHDRDHDEVD
jgi:hypothetical protein